ncbi:MAG: hypothetical protein AB1649_20540 [Chloroflexota bacterium]
MNVIREPRQRGFSQPCPLWQGQCTIYTSPQYPRFCRTYKCKLLKEVLDEITPLPAALNVIEQVKGMIGELEARLPASSSDNFRERLVAEIESLEATAQLDQAQSDFLLKVQVLLNFFEDRFGVNDLVEKAQEK